MRLQRSQDVSIQGVACVLWLYSFGQVLQRSDGTSCDHPVG
jgi:hypothetical protein